MQKWARKINEELFFEIEDFLEKRAVDTAQRDTHCV